MFAWVWNMAHLDIGCGKRHEERPKFPKRFLCLSTGGNTLLRTDDLLRSNILFDIALRPCSIIR